MIMNFIRGFCMALADSVPGVSGGTIAFLLGFYDQFISSLNALLSGSGKERKEALVFLLKLGIGWVIGFLAAVSVLSRIFNERIYEISSLFIGFILFAIPIVMKEEKSSMKLSCENLIAILLGIGIVVLITYFNPINAQDSSVNLAHLDIGMILYVFFAAMISISAMVLPGMSGSTLLLVFGLYIPIMNAIRSLMEFNFAYLPVMIVFALGILTGVISTIRIIKWALDVHRSFMIWLIIGLMLGSLYAITMGPMTLEVPKAPLNMASFHFLWFLIGGIIILGLQKLKMITEKK